MEPPSSLTLATAVAPQGPLRGPRGRPPTDRRSRIRGGKLGLGRLVAVLCYLWAAPSSAVGLVAALLLFALVGARAHWHRGVLEVRAVPRGPRRARWLQRLPFVAITLGHVVLARDHRTMVRCRAHERVHVRQCERWGPLFFPAYLVAGAWQALRGRGAYRDNPFEVQARGGA